MHASSVFPSVASAPSHPTSPPALPWTSGTQARTSCSTAENGSGKTSLFRALRDLCDTSTKPREYAAHQNIFQQSEDDAISLELTSGTPSEFRWDFGEQHPKETEGAPFQAFARSCLFLDYRDLLETNFVHRSGAPNLYTLLIETILPDLPAPSRRLAELHQEMLAKKPENQGKKLVESAKSAANAFAETLKGHLPEVVSEANRLLAKLQKGTALQLEPPTKLTYSKDARDFTGKEVILSVTYNGKPVPEPQHFLNEARLTAMALALYLAAARITRSGRPGIMVLDDVLIGLDLSNRIPLLQLLKDDFAEWQILLFTHDHTWYELAREYTEHANTWTHREMYLIESHESRAAIPEIKDGMSALDRANAHLNDNDKMAAAVYLRAAFESRLRTVCNDKGIEIPFKKQLKEVKADVLWKGIVKRQEQREALQISEAAKNHPDFISRALIQKVEMMRSTILNKLSHTDSPTFEKSEIESARDTIQELQTHSFPKSAP